MPAEEQVLRGALVGCGFFGQIQLEAWRRMDNVEIVAACDVDRAKAQTAAPSAYTDVQEMLSTERLDFVDIATRPDTHLSFVRAAAEHGIPSICQKPMALSLEDAAEIVNVARETGVRVLIHENWRWQPWYREAHRRIAAGAIGTPITYAFRHRQRDGLGPAPYPNQPYFKDMPKLLMFETLIHYVDTARFLFGDIAGVYARKRRHNPVIQGEDGAILMLDHTAGVVGTINGNRYLNPERTGPAMGEAIFEGDESWISVDAPGNLYVAGELAWQSPNTPGYKGDSVKATQEHLIECLRTGERSESEADVYFESFRVIEAAYLSAESGRRESL